MTAKQAILNTTLHILTKLGLTPAEIVALRLANLHLAGKEPHLQLISEGQTDPKIISLELEAHRLLVSWLVARPDSASNFLFPGQNDQGMTIAELEQELAHKTAPRQDDSISMRPVTPAPAPSVRPMTAPIRPITRSMRPLTRPEGVIPLSRPYVPAPPVPESQPRRAPTAPHAPIVKAEEKLPPEPIKTDLISPEIETRSTEEITVQEITAEKITAEKITPQPETLPTETLPLEPPPSQATSLTELSKPNQLTARQASQKSGQSWMRLAIPLAIMAVAFIVCVMCAVGGLATWQFMPDVVAKLGQLSTPQAKATVAPTASITPTLTTTEPTPSSPPPIPTINSPLPTPTAMLIITATPTLPLPATATATVVIPTATSTATTTATTMITPTSTVPPTSTAVPPTNTVAPTRAPVVAEPTNTADPLTTVKISATLELVKTPKPEMIYQAPKLLSPENNVLFLPHDLIEFHWQSEKLAENEHYAIRVVCQFQGAEKVEGANITNLQWTMPFRLFGQVDGPQNFYQWYVVIENADGKAISPRSEMRTFTWK